jgi:hypothetical protein
VEKAREEKSWEKRGSREVMLKTKQVTQFWLIRSIPRSVDVVSQGKMYSHSYSRSCEDEDGKDRHAKQVNYVMWFKGNT